MATESTTTGTEGTETGTEGQQGTEASTTSETEGQETQPKPGTEEPVKLPEDHPLVKTLAANKATLASQKTEITELRAKSAQVTKLEGELAARPTQEAVDTLQTRYDRLEAFAQAVGIGKALDSRTFTRDLFETDKDIKQLVKEWNQANPSATSTALGSQGAKPADGKVDPNVLLRAALK